MAEKLPPHDIEAEEALLGSLLLGANISSTLIKPEDFYSERNRWVYEACEKLAEREVSINQITLANELKDKLENIGGAAYLSHLIACTPTSLDFPYYCEIVNRCSFYRRMIAVSDQIAILGYEANNDISKSIDRADELLLELRKNNSPSVIIDPKRRVEILNERYAKLYELEAGAAIQTGLTDLDRFLGGGFYGGDLIIIGARSSMGKTTMLQNIANNIARTGNVLYFSCEMDVNALGDRDVAGKVGVSINTVRLGKYDTELYCQITASLEEIGQYKIYTYDDTPITTAKIMQAATNLHLRHKLSGIAVDYLGLLDDDSKENRNITLGHMTRKLKQVALKLDVPVFAAHQLSRAVESREDKRPMLSDLRESGHIEEDADVVMFLYRDSYYYDKEAWYASHEGDYPENITEVIIAKQRQGESNRTIRLQYDKDHQIFRDLARV
jgi:replicative DNA helicase